MDKKMTMADLMASMEHKQVTFQRGDKVKGRVVIISSNEIVLDLGAKAEGVISKNDFPPEELKNLKIGDKIEAFVISQGNESGQISLSLQGAFLSFNPKNVQQQKKWQKVIIAYERKNKVVGRVVEVNKGGLVVEVDKIRGFLPTSQVSLHLLGKRGQDVDLSGLVGQDISVSIIEIDPKSNQLILSTRGQIDEGVRSKLDKFEAGQSVIGKIAAITPVGLMVSIKDRSASGGDLDGVEGVVYQQEVSWEPLEDLNSSFRVGDEVEALVTGKDLDLGRVNLSIRQLSEDPFEKLVGKYGEEGMVSGLVSEINTSGVVVRLPNGVEGIIPLSKIGLNLDYKIGQETPVYIDGIDKAKRKLNLVPFLTSTKNLIYK